MSVDVRRSAEAYGTVLWQLHQVRTLIGWALPCSVAAPSSACMLGGTCGGVYGELASTAETSVTLMLKVVVWLREVGVMMRGRIQRHTLTALRSRGTV